MVMTLRMLETALIELGLKVDVEGKSIIHATKGRFAPAIHSVVTIDEDEAGCTVLAALSEVIAPEKRVAVCELLNLVHGQSLWNVRFHLDETGQVFSAGKVLLWGKPFNPNQLGDVFFSQLVTTDRLHPCLIAVNEEGKTPEEAFELFFLTPPSSNPGDDGPETDS